VSSPSFAVLVVTLARDQPILSIIKNLASRAQSEAFGSGGPASLLRLARFEIG
jgi:hypothetical protein